MELLLVLLDSLAVAVGEGGFVELVEERREHLDERSFEEVVGEIVVSVYFAAFESSAVDPLEVLPEVGSDLLEFGEVEQFALAQVVELLEVP